MIRNTTNLEGRARAELGVQLLEAINRSAPMEEIRALVERGAEVDSKDNKSWTPLYHACAHNNIELATFLIERGADVNINPNNDWTLLHKACVHNYTDLATFLIERGADINIQDRFGETPLHKACGRNNTDLAIFLIERGADINIQDRFGETPLHKACVTNSLRVATLLIWREAKVDLSLLKAFVGQNEWCQIDEIINNQTSEHLNLHLSEDAKIAILDILYFPWGYNGSIHFVDHEDRHLINAIGEALPHFDEEPVYLLK